MARVRSVSASSVSSAYSRSSSVSYVSVGRRGLGYDGEEAEKRRRAAVREKGWNKIAKRATSTDKAKAYDRERRQQERTKNLARRAVGWEPPRQTVKKLNYNDSLLEEVQTGKKPRRKKAFGVSAWSKSPERGPKKPAKYRAMSPPCRPPPPEIKYLPSCSEFLAYKNLKRRPRSGHSGCI